MPNRAGGAATHGGREHSLPRRRLSLQTESAHDVA